MFEALFGAIFIGSIIMGSLFLYWLKYVYVEKDENDKRSQYSPISQNVKDENNNNKTLYKVDPNFINKRKSKQN